MAGMRVKDGMSEYKSCQNTILFLIADTGAGHRSAANAIYHAMRVLTEPLGDEWRAYIVDVFAECGRFPLRQSIALYRPTIQRAPHLYGHIFHATNSERGFHSARRLCQPFLAQGLRALINQIHPDVIVSIHPLLNHATLDILRETQLRIPLITVVTDLVTVHRSWIAPGVDACVVPTKRARDIACAAGLSESRVHLLGMPIHPQFGRLGGGTQQHRRAALGLDPGLPVLLFAGGGDGAGGLQEALAALRNLSLPAQFVVLTGNNERLYETLARERSHFKVPLHVRRFVTNIADYMRAADALVTKAGPGMICEAMACELPLVFVGAVPGQEDGNIGYALKRGVGMRVSQVEALGATLRNLLEPYNPQLREWRSNARRFGANTNGSFDIARLIFSYLPAFDYDALWQSETLLEISPVAHVSPSPAFAEVIA